MSPSSLAASWPPWCAASKNPLPRFFTSSTTRYLPSARAVPADMHAVASTAAAIRIHWFFVIVDLLGYRRRARLGRFAQAQDGSLVRAHRVEPGQPHWNAAALAVVIPDRSPGQRFLLFEQCQARREVAARLDLGEPRRGLEQRPQQRAA